MSAIFIDGFLKDKIQTATQVIHVGDKSYDITTAEGDVITIRYPKQSPMIGTHSIIINIPGHGTFTVPLIGTGARILNMASARATEAEKNPVEQTQSNEMVDIQKQFVVAQVKVLTKMLKHATHIELKEEKKEYTYNNNKVYEFDTNLYVTMADGTKMNATVVPDSYHKYGEHYYNIEIVGTTVNFNVPHSVLQDLGFIDALESRAKDLKVKAGFYGYLPTHTAMSPR